MRARIPSASALRAALVAAGIAGCVLLVLATFAAIVEIRVGTTTRLASGDTELSGWERHGPALLLLALLAALMLAGAWRGSRPAASAVAAAGVVALGIALIWDVPALDDTRGYEELYEGAEAGPRSGWYLETLGGALVLLAGGALMVLFGRTADADAGGDRDRDARGSRRASSRRPSPPTAAGSISVGPSDEQRPSQPDGA